MTSKSTKKTWRKAIKILDKRRVFYYLMEALIVNLVQLKSVRSEKKPDFYKWKCFLPNAFSGECSSSIAAISAVGRTTSWLCFVRDSFKEFYHSSFPFPMTRCWVMAVRTWNVYENCLVGKGCHGNRPSTFLIVYLKDAHFVTVPWEPESKINQ